MKLLHAATALLLAAALTLSLGAAAPREHPTVVVGTFDSRAVAIAYTRSAAFQEHLAGLRAELERARAAGDAERVAELEALGPAMQERIHRQGFGTAPVDDVVARIDARLPQIAREAGVDVIVSQWALAYRGPAARFVDVTDGLVAEFEPDAATLKAIREIRKTDPVPADQLDEHRH